MLILRNTKGSPLTNQEIDDNFEYLNEKLRVKVQNIRSTSSYIIEADAIQANINELKEDVTIETPSGTPIGCHHLLIRIKDDGTPRTISWSSAWRGSLPTTTTADKYMYVGAIYNPIDLIWDVIGYSVEN